MEPSSCSTPDSPARLILKRYLHLQHTRLSLLKEFQVVLESCLSKSSGQPDTNLCEANPNQHHHHADITISDNVDPIDPVISSELPPSSCRHEYKDIDTNPDDYIEQVISISTSGFLEIGDEVKLLMEMLESNLKRSDLFGLLKKIEDLENKKMSEHLQRNLLRRKERLRGQDFTDAIDTHQKNVNLLEESISNLMAEVQAELAELS